MFYKNALKMGTSEGTVQCTYATIYADNRGTRPLFSFQRKDWAAAPGFGFGGRGMIDDLDTKNYGNMSYGFASGNAYLVDEGIVATYTGYGREGVIGWDDGKALRGESTVYTTFDFPLVVANEWSADRYVPVRLVQEAAAFLRGKGTCTFQSPESLHTHINIYRTRGAWALSVSAMRAVIASGEAEFPIILWPEMTNMPNLLTAEGSECGRMKGNL